MSQRRRFGIDMVLALSAALNAYAYAYSHHAVNLGVAVLCGIGALVKWPT